MNTQIEAKTEELLADENIKVRIILNNETGIEQYSVCVDNGPDKGFWLDSFLTFVEALNFVQKQNLKGHRYLGFTNALFKNGYNSPIRMSHAEYHQKINNLADNFRLELEQLIRIYKGGNVWS